MNKGDVNFIEESYLFVFMKMEKMIGQDKFKFNSIFKIYMFLNNYNIFIIFFILLYLFYNYFFIILYYFYMSWIGDSAPRQTNNNNKDD